VSAQLSLADIGRIYPVLAPQLERVLTRHLGAPAGVVEEACQRAWGRLITHRTEVDPERALSWLATTARREAVEAMRDSARHLSLDEVLEQPAAAACDPARIVELRDRLAAIAQLPERQRRLVWLRGLGYGAAEITARTGDSTRTVERQLVSARRRLREPEARWG
jgi:RNA polymerase sigma factor (sigma-70 family)